jgi:hypothetical protein
MSHLSVPTLHVQFSDFSIDGTGAHYVSMFMGVLNVLSFCGLVVSVEDYKHRGPGFDSRALLRIFLRGLGLERGPLSLVIG